MKMPPLLLWNASASAPLGLYAIRKMAVPTAGALAVLAPPDKVARFAARRGYLPLGVPMLKHIEGLPGSQVCRAGRVIMAQPIMSWPRKAWRRRLSAGWSIVGSMTN